MAAACACSIRRPFPPDRRARRRADRGKATTPTSPCRRGRPRTSDSSRSGAIAIEPSPTPGIKACSRHSRRDARAPAPLRTGVGRPHRHYRQADAIHERRGKVHRPAGLSSRSPFVAVALYLPSIALAHLAFAIRRLRDVFAISCVSASRTTPTPVDVLRSRVFSTPLPPAQHLSPRALVATPPVARSRAAASVRIRARRARSIST